MGLHVYVAIAQISWPAASGAISAHSHKKRASKRASGIASYNLSVAQNTEGIRHSLPFYGFHLPAIFAQIPTYAPRFSGGARTASQTVQSVTDSVASPAKLHSSEDVRMPDA